MILLTVILWCCTVFCQKLVEADTPIKRGCPLLCVCYQEQLGISVTCKSNLISKIPDITLPAHSITIESSQITEIPNNVFRHAGGNITSLHLTDTEISSIKNDAFVGLENTVSLSLTSNQLTFINKDVLVPLHNLQSLSIQNNKLNSFDNCCLRNLSVLFLGGNLITSVKIHSCFERSEKLRTLNVRGNNIKDIQREDFFHLRKTNLTNLALDQCNLQVLKNDSFFYLRHLKVLTLSYNRLTFLPPGVFQWQKDLRNLAISNNLFTSMPESSFFYLNRLVMLVIGYNKNIKDFKPGPLFRKFTYLKSLNLNGLSFTNLTNNTFQHLDRCPIEVLGLRQCRIRSIEPAAFTPISSSLQTFVIDANPLSAKELQSLLWGIRNATFEVLSFNELKLSDLNNKTFRYMNYESVLNIIITNSEITKIGKGVFSFMTYLKKIDLSHNKISHIEKDGLGNLQYLVELILSKNYMTKIPSVWNGEIPSNLEHLSLSSNNIEIITQDSFLGLENLKTLALKGSGIKTLGRRSLEPLKSLTYLDLADNKLGTLAAFSGILPNSLEYLFIGGNRINNFNDADFTKINNLVQLDMSYQIPEPKNMSFVLKKLISPLHKLEKLIAISLGITRFEADTFKNNSNLTLLSLNNNRIKSWDPLIFKPLKKLEQLTLSKNSILNVNAKSFEFLESLQKLDLSSNSFRCDCDLLWFRNTFLYEDNIYIDNIQEEKAYICASPSAMKGKNILDFHPDAKSCATRTTFTLVISTLSSFVCATFIISAILRYRWYIRYWVYLLRVRRKQYAQVNNRENFRYDAFVSYNSKDTRWVIQQLLPALEYNGEFKLCLYDRDWVVGADIAECVIESIENSRKTILILSDNFAQSEWCQFELSLAHHKLLNDKIDVLVPILLSDIQARYISARMRALLTEKIYIEWPQDRDKEEHFWKGLKAALKKP